MTKKAIQRRKIVYMIEQFILGCICCGAFCCFMKVMSLILPAAA